MITMEYIRRIRKQITTENIENIQKQRNTRYCQEAEDMIRDLSITTDLKPSDIYKMVRNESEKKQWSMGSRAKLFRLVLGFRETC